MDPRGSGAMASGTWDNTRDWVPSVYLLFGEWKYQRSSRMHKVRRLVCSRVHVAVYIFYNSPGLLYLNPGALSRCVLGFSLSGADTRALGIRSRGNSCFRGRYPAFYVPTHAVLTITQVVVLFHRFVLP